MKAQNFVSLIALQMLVWTNFQHAMATEPSCADLMKVEITREEVAEIIADLKKPHKPGEYGVRLLTDEPEEAPDPDRPYPIQLPDGRVLQMIGLSGGKAIFSENLAELFNGGVVPISRVDLYNRNGHKYASEVDSNGKPLHYAHNSSLWDVYAIQFRDSSGNLRTKIFGGGMGDDASGKPYLMSGETATTRQRLFFEGEFEIGPEGSFKLIGKDPYAPLNKITPVPGEWIMTAGDKYFRHGYGGGPVTLLNGELYTTTDGAVPFPHEEVIESRVDELGGALPWLTVQSMTLMDQELGEAVAPSKVIWSPFNQNGEPFAAAIRPSYDGSPLTEGIHLVPMHDGRPIKSSAELKELRENGKKIYFNGMHSHGEFYGEYGGSAIRMDENFSNPQPSLTENGELDDFLKVLAPIFAWRGRPVSAFAELKLTHLVIEDQEYVLAHGVDRSKIPSGIPMNKKPAKTEHWEHFNRQVMVFPIRRTATARGDKIEIMDNTGLLERLSRYKAPVIWND